MILNIYLFLFYFNSKINNIWLLYVKIWGRMTKIKTLILKNYFTGRMTKKYYGIFFSALFVARDFYSRKFTLLIINEQFATLFILSQFNDKLVAVILLVILIIVKWFLRLSIFNDLYLFLKHLYVVLMLAFIPFFISKFKEIIC